VSKEGCSGGSFKPGFCPGSTDIQSCVKKSQPPPPPALGQDCKSILSRTLTPTMASTTRPTKSSDSPHRNSTGSSYTTKLFRLILRNRDAAKIVLGGPSARGFFVVRLTNVRDSKPAECLSNAGWTVASAWDLNMTLEDLVASSTLFLGTFACFARNRL
jgi:hypothetical protein